MVHVVVLASSCAICELQLCTRPGEPGLTPLFMTYLWCEQTYLVATLACYMNFHIFLYADSEKRNIFLAMYEWENHTCVRFKPRTTEEHYVAFVPGIGWVDHCAYACQHVACSAAYFLCTCVCVSIHIFYVDKRNKFKVRMSTGGMFYSTKKVSNDQWSRL